MTYNTLFLWKINATLSLRPPTDIYAYTDQRACVLRLMDARRLVGVRYEMGLFLQVKLIAKRELEHAVAVVALVECLRHAEVVATIYHEVVELIREAQWYGEVERLGMKTRAVAFHSVAISVILVVGLEARLQTHLKGEVLCHIEIGEYGHVDVVETHRHAVVLTALHRVYRTEADAHLARDLIFALGTNGNAHTHVGAWLIGKAGYVQAYLGLNSKRAYLVLSISCY